MIQINYENNRFAKLENDIEELSRMIKKLRLVSGSVILVQFLIILVLM